VLNDDRADWQQAYALFPGDVAYVWHGAMHGDIVATGLAACGQIVWAKQHFTRELTGTAAAARSPGRVVAGPHRADR
jgi:hypothetical protein